MLFFKWQDIKEVYMAITVNCVVVLDKNRIASGSDDETIMIWDMKIADPIRVLENKEKVNCL